MLRNLFIVLILFVVVFGSLGPIQRSEAQDNEDVLVFFSAYIPAFGRELWQYDGTEAIMIADIFPGEPNSEPAWLTFYNGDLYFSAFNPSIGNELWVYDIESELLSPIDILTGEESTDPTWLTVYDDQLCFAGNSISLGRDIWCYDGAKATFYDVVVGFESSIPTELTVSGDSLYFAGDIGILGRELIGFNGTEFKTHDILIGIESGNPTELVDYANTLYFSLESGTNNLGREIGYYDTQANLNGFIDINAGEDSGSPTDLVVYNDKLYFSAYSTPQNGGSGRELWVYDATTGFEPTIDINTNVESNGTADSNVAWLTVVGDVLYFAGESDFATEQVLWVYDSVSGVADIAVDINFGVGDSDIRWISSANDMLYFSAFSDPSAGGSGIELWGYSIGDGTAFPLADIFTGESSSDPGWLTLSN